MKQKYTIAKDRKTGGLTIQEHAELSKDMFSLVCEESYDKQKIEKALTEGRTALIATLRTPNLYPIADYIEQIADAVSRLYNEKEAQEDQVELVFDDVELFQQEEEDIEPDEDEDSVEIDDLLDDDTPDDESSDDDETPD
jgi:hypothetical protein